MFNIKEYLKSIGITQKDFADRVGLSRPTLDTYIDLYENGNPIPKERYAIAFSTLFDEGPYTSEDFTSKLQRIEKLFNRDERYEISELEPLAADYVTSILRNMKRDMMLIDWNEDVYTFINILISNYRRNEIMQQLAEYFIFLNAFRDADEIEEKQKSYFANFYRTFDALLKNPKEYNKDNYLGFLKRCEEIKVDKEKDARSVKKQLLDQIQKIVDEGKKKGIIFSEEEIITEINNGLNNKLEI